MFWCNLKPFSAKQVTAEINNCTDLQYLNLEGNTLGVEASKHIAKALEKHPEFKRALWKDMFTGRLKEEIPKALVNDMVVVNCVLITYILGIFRKWACNSRC